MKYQFLIDFILSSEEEVDEYFLLKHIEQSHADFFKPLGDSPPLYKKHFFLFHQLYQLRDELQKQDRGLVISGTKISICGRAKSSFEISKTDVLSEFYLNEDNLNLTDEEVSVMLNQFWQRYLAIDKKAEALRLLGLDNQQNLSLKVIKKRFNELAQKHHPDKGGDEKVFIKLKDAVTSLKYLFD